MRHSNTLALAALAIGWSSSVALAEVTWEEDVRPILKTHCFHCHGEAGEKESGLDLRLHRFVMQGGESGAAIVAGDAAKSLLLQRLVDGEMPPDMDKQLSAAEIDTIRQWIVAGAV
ncbi:MAG: hypothetical protein KDA58_16655, partial [Planctomycetaceae bacterium]|nr:hypothetical protein [Planctomycetaceae bacterium]